MIFEFKLVHRDFFRSYNIFYVLKSPTFSLNDIFLQYNLNLLTCQFLLVI